MKLSEIWSGEPPASLFDGEEEYRQSLVARDLTPECIDARMAGWRMWRKINWLKERGLWNPDGRGVAERLRLAEQRLKAREGAA